MSRSQFILGVALLVVSATVAFTISFRDHHPSTSPSALVNDGDQSPNPSRVRQIGSSPIPEPSPRRDQTFYEVTVSDRALAPIAKVVKEESLQQLEALTDRYNLTTSQRRSIFPLIAARHPQYQDGLVINGSLIPPSGDTTSLESAMHPLLQEDQQEKLEDDILSRNEWWGEIISQLRDDLDEAISSGEMVPEVSPIPRTTPGTPAPGDGETVENPDVDPTNLFEK